MIHTVGPDLAGRPRRRGPAPRELLPPLPRGRRRAGRPLGGVPGHQHRRLRLPGRRGHRRSRSSTVRSTITERRDRPLRLLRRRGARALRARARHLRLRSTTGATRRRITESVGTAGRRFPTPSRSARPPARRRGEPSSIRSRRARRSERRRLSPPEPSSGRWRGTHSRGARASTGGTPRRAATGTSGCVAHACRGS